MLLLLMLCRLVKKFIVVVSKMKASKGTRNTCW